MHVLIDGIHLGPKMKGVGRYVMRTLEQLIELEPGWTFTVLHLADQKVEAKVRNVRFVPVGWTNHLQHGFQTVPNAVKTWSPDVVFIPYECPVRVCHRAFVSLCHDVPKAIRAAQLRAQVLEGQSIDLWRRIDRKFRDGVDDHLLARTLRSANVVLANSEYVRRWLEHEVGLDRARLAVAPCAPGADFAGLSRDIDVGRARARLGFDAGWVLCFDTGDPRESSQTVIEAYTRLVRRRSDLREGLIIAGVRDADRARVERKIAPLGSRARLVPFIGEDRVSELAELYAAAAVYVEPSLHEGFGMQVIEAMACGAPVISSDRGALPDVARAAASFFDPEKPIELEAKLDALLSNRELGRSLVEAGRARAACYSWTETAKVVRAALADAGSDVRRGAA